MSVLTVTLIMLVVGAIILSPILGFMISGLKSGQDLESRVQEYYAADAAVADARYRIEYDYLPEEMLGVWSEDDYNPSNAVEYTISGGINNKEVTYTIQPIWVLQDLEDPAYGVNGRTPPDFDEEEPWYLELAMTTDVIGQGKVKVSIIYDGDLTIDRIGVWLPPGLDYVTGSSTFEQFYPWEPLYCDELRMSISPRKGGTAIVWDRWGPLSEEYIALSSLPESGGSRIIEFEFTPGGQSTQGIFSWMRVQAEGDNYLCWDVDAKLYRIESTATTASTGKSTTLEALTSKSEFREFGSVIEGDYVATGDTLMVSYHSPSYYLDTLLSESDAIVDDIPQDTQVIAAYLYWSAWVYEVSEQTIWGPENCSDFIWPVMNWTAGSSWSISSDWDRRFRGHYSSGDDSVRYLTMSSSIDLSAYAGQTVKISWQQDESGADYDDRLYFAFSADDGGTWSSNFEAFHGDNPDSPFAYTIPNDYLTDSFRMRFYLYGFSGSYRPTEYCYIDNITITAAGTPADTTAFFEIDGDRVYFDENGDPQVDPFGTKELTADSYTVHDQVAEFGWGAGYDYGCFKDVTDLVLAFTDVGNATYTVGGVYGKPDEWDNRDWQWGDWSYAGWSIIIIYSSHETQGHQLYLYDDFIYSDSDHSGVDPPVDVDFDEDGSPGGVITGFLVPEQIPGETIVARISCFVVEGDHRLTGDNLQFNGTKLWDGINCEHNSRGSPNNVWNAQGLEVSAPGVDIDTFDVTWESGLLEPGDTEAQVDMWTYSDGWNLVYIILSFRSETTTGGLLTYIYR